MLYLLAEAAMAPPNFVAVGTAAIVALTPVLSVVILWLLKIAWSKVPGSLVLIIAPLLGMGIDFFLSWLSGHPSANPFVAALLGAVAVYLREFVTTVLSKGVLGPVSVTKWMV